MTRLAYYTFVTASLAVITACLALTAAAFADPSLLNLVQQ